MLPVEVAPGVAMADEAEPPVDPRAEVDLPRYRRMFEQWRDLTQESRREAQLDDDYYHGNQLTSAERAALAARGQPDIVINRTRAAVNGILGVLERGRSDPRAYPRTPGDDDAADVATDTLRYIGDKNRFSKTKGRAFRDLLVPGSCAAIVEVGGERDVVVRRVRYEEFVYDPKSREEDFSDARFLGIAKWMYADDVAAIYPDDKTVIASCVSGEGLTDDLLRDRPDNLYWIDKRERRLMVVELYHREQTWKRCVFVASAVLEYGDSPYTDDRGRPHCPIEAMSAYVDKDNNRTGVVRDMRGPQDEINKRRSKLLHLITVSQIQAVDQSAMVVDAADARKEAARPDGVIPFGWQKVPTSDMAMGQAQLLQEAKNEIERLGPNPAVIGRESAGASGRALQARTQAGMIELAPIFGALEDWELRVWRQCWSRAKQFWREPQWIRVTDDEDAPKFVGLNMPKGPPVPKMGQDGQPEIDPETGEPVTDEGPLDSLPRDEMGQPQPVFGYKNTLAEMDVDIILDATPDTANIQAEQFADLAQLAANPLYAQQVPFEIMLELSSVPHKRRLINKIKEGREQQAKAQAQQAEMQAKMMAEKLSADIRKTDSETELNAAKAQSTTSEATIDAFRAGGELATAAGESGVNGMMPLPQ